MNEHEQRARARKAYRIARVLRHAEDVETEAWLDAAPAERERVAELAQVKMPSDTTWAVAVEILGQMRAEP